MDKAFSLYNTSDSLKNRHPFIDTAQEEIAEESVLVFDGYGIDGIKRNISSLEDDSFSDEEKKKALRILSLKLSSHESRMRAVCGLSIVKSLIFLLEKNQFGEEIEELCCELVEMISTIQEGRQQFFKAGGIPLLLNVMRNKANSKGGKNRCAASRALLEISKSDEGTRLLIKGHPSDSSQGNKVIDTLAWLLQFEESKIPDMMILSVLESLVQISFAVPEGRHYMADIGILKEISQLLKKKFHIDSNVNLYEMINGNEALIASLKSACRLTWNCTLDGPGKKFAKDQIFFELVKVLYCTLEMRTKYEDILHLLIGSFSSIFIDELAKPLAIKNIPTYSNSSTNIVEILSQLLIDMSDSSKEDDLWNSKKSKTIKHCEELTLVALRLASESSDTRLEVVKYLDSYPVILETVFSTTSSFYPFGSQTPDLLPSHKYCFIHKQ